jgi:amino acid transporter
MDEYEPGMDPETKRYLRKVINSFMIGAFWLILLSTFGLYFGMAIIVGSWDIYNTIFYLFFALSFAWLMRYYYRNWKDGR